MKMLKKIFCYSLLLFFVFSFNVNIVNAQTPPPEPKKNVVDEMRKAIGNIGLDLKGIDKEGNPTADTEIILAGLITGVLSLLGVVFLLLIIYGGFLWMTAQGNDEQIGKAKKMIISSAIGITIIIFAYVISVVVIELLQTNIATT